MVLTYLKLNKVIFIFLVLTLLAPLKSQSLEKEIEKIFALGNEEILKDYIGPLSETFGANLGSAIYYSAESFSFPHFDIGVSYLSTTVPRDGFVTDSTNNSTVFGAELNDSSVTSGLNIDHFNLPVIQFNIGLGDNTNLLVRYIHWNMNKVGKIRVIGAGIKYELENLLSITPIPLNIAILAMYQKYEIDNFLDGAVFNISILGSKDVGIIPLQLYGGAGFLNNITEVKDPASETKLAVSISGLEEVRYQIGLNYSFLFSNLSIEYNFGRYRTVSSGLRIIF